MEEIKNTRKLTLREFAMVYSAKKDIPPDIIIRINSEKSVNDDVSMDSNESYAKYYVPRDLRCLLKEDYKDPYRDVSVPKGSYLCADDSLLSEFLISMLISNLRTKEIAINFLQTYGVVVCDYKNLMAKQ